tara:strand:+ start:115 stop:1455 length:1341 start_codon:yes stop_codon:yes gene_type:complete
MPFLGKTPKQVELSSFGTRVKDDFTANGSTTAFTLSKSVANPNDIAVFVGNVRQEPTDAYTVSGTTLTMSEAPATGLNFYVVHTAGTIESSVVPADGTITGAKIENNPTIAGNLAVNGNINLSTTNTFLTGAGHNVVQVDATKTYLYGGTGGVQFRTADNASPLVDITNSGKVGIGTDSPVTNLDVVTTSAGTRARIRSNSTNAPTAGLELCRGTDSTFGADNYTDYLIENVNGGHLAFKSAINGTTSERIRIDSNGKILIARSSTAESCRMDISHGTSWGLILDGDGSGTDNHIMFSRSGGTRGYITSSSSSVSYNTSSDYRLKENVVDLTGASARVNQLNPSRFNFIADGTDTVVDGFIAHEVATVVPEAITGAKDEVKVWKDSEELPDGVSVGDNKLDEDGNTIPIYQGIDQSKLVPLLTAALQEALTEIASLKTRVQSLEDA